MTARLVDKDWDPEDPFSTSFDSLGRAAAWMSASGSTFEHRPPEEDIGDDEEGDDE